MKVLYELDLNDIIRIVAEKYGVNPAKIKKINKDGLNYLTVDMSETETPAPVPFQDYVSPFLSQKEEPAPEQKEPEKPQTAEADQILKELHKVQKKETKPGIDGDITVYTCPICKKKFDIEKYPQYAYKKRIFNHNHIFCGYDCMRKAEKALNP